MIDLKKIEAGAKEIYEDSFDISLLQEDLENKLDEIYQNSVTFKSGKLSKNAFKVNESELKKDSLALMKAIKEKLKSNMALINSIREEIKGQGKKKAAKKGK